MSDTNLSEKISDSILNFFKKTTVLEKIDKFEFYIKSIVFMSSIYLTGNMLCNYIMLQNQSKYNNNISSEVNCIKNIKIKMLYDNIIVLHNKIDALEVKLTNLIETQQYTLNKIYISSTFLENPKQQNIKNDLPNLVTSIEEHDKIEEHNKNEEDYCEISNECYDNIPLNNLKKTTGLKGWLF
jgi:GTPase involved in cell partitioning and DNA repair